MTGAIIDQKQETTNTLAVDDEDRVTTTKADIAYTKATRSASSWTTSRARPRCSPSCTATLPIIPIILGLILTGGRLPARTSQQPETTSAPTKHAAVV